MAIRSRLLAMQNVPSGIHLAVGRDWEPERKITKMSPPMVQYGPMVRLRNKLGLFQQLSCLFYLPTAVCQLTPPNTPVHSRSIQVLTRQTGRGIGP